MKSLVIAARASLSAFLLVLCLPGSLVALSVADVVRLSRMRYPDEEILRMIRVADSRFLLSAGEAGRLRQDGVTEEVISEMLSRPAWEQEERPAADDSAGKLPRGRATIKGSGPDVRIENAEAFHRVSRESGSLLDDVTGLTEGGVSEETILVYVKARRTQLPPVLAAEDLLRLRKSGVSETVIRYLAGRAAVDVGPTGEGRKGEVSYESAEAQGYPPDTGYASIPAYPAGYPPFYGGHSISYPGYFFVGHRGSFGRHPFFHRAPVFFGHRRFRDGFSPHRHFFFHHDPFFGHHHFGHHGFFGHPGFSGQGFGGARRVPVGPGGFAGPPAGRVAHTSMGPTGGGLASGRR